MRAGSEYARGWWAGIRVRQGVVGRYQSTLGGGGQGSEYVRQVGIRVHWAGIRIRTPSRDQSTLGRDQNTYAREWWAGIRVH